MTPAEHLQIFLDVVSIASVVGLYTGLMFTFLVKMK